MGVRPDGVGVAVGFEPMTYRRMYENVIEQVLAMLHSGKLRLGDRLPPERELAELTGVSRPTLREAFRVLEQQGILRATPGGGRFIVGVPKPDDDKDAPLDRLESAAIEDLLEARETLETRIVELACKRASPGDLAAIGEVLAHWPAEGPLTTNVILEHDRAFHLAVAEAAHNVVLTTLVGVSLELLDKFRPIRLNSKQRVVQIKREHQAIHEALAARDAEEARLAIRVQMRNIRRRIHQTSVTSPIII